MANQPGAKLQDALLCYTQFECKRYHPYTKLKNRCIFLNRDNRDKNTCGFMNRNNYYKYLQWIEIIVIYTINEQTVFTEMESDSFLFWNPITCPRSPLEPPRPLAGSSNDCSSLCASPQHICSRVSITYCNLSPCSRTPIPCSITWTKWTTVLPVPVIRNFHGIITSPFGL